MNLRMAHSQLITLFVDAQGSPMERAAAVPRYLLLRYGNTDSAIISRTSIDPNEGGHFS